MQGKERDVRIKDGFVLRDVAGQTVVIATGEASRDFHGMVKLNGKGFLAATMRKISPRSS